jgi:U3 small nucleolar ribonucleoprotein protein LCP5
MRDLLNEFDDQPEEETATGGAITMQNRESKAFVEERERQEYEEDNFIRLTTTKKELKRRQKDFLQTRIDDELQNMNDFSSLSKVRKEDDFSLMSRKQRVSENFQPDELLTDFNEFQHQRKRVVKQKKHQHNKRRKH